MRKKKASLENVNEARPWIETLVTTLQEVEEEEDSEAKEEMEGEAGAEAMGLGELVYCMRMVGKFCTTLQCMHLLSISPTTLKQLPLINAQHS